MYPTLPHEPQRKEPEIDLFPDTQGGDSKPGLSNYLDEFLSAIKIFGYLERPVFHELTRHMQTRRLVAGETFLLEEEKGFCLVVDGLMQIFVKQNRQGENGECTCGECSLCEVNSKTSRKRDPREGAFHDEEDESVKGAQGYQLLTEVKNGAPLSSLFTILSLFTEDVKLRHEFDDFDGGADSSASSTFGRAGDGPETPFTPITDTARPSSSSGHPMQRGASGDYPRGPLPSVPPLSLNDEAPSHIPSRPNTPMEDRPKRPKSKKTQSVHPDIIARASVDTTIAVIPATAFRRLTRVYPKATAHIVQVILTRFQRVTFLTAYSYLGLTSEVLRTEKFMNKYTMYELPNYLRGGALDRLKEKFKTEQERAAPEDQMKGLVLHNPSANANKRRTSSISMRKEALIHAKLAGTKGTPSAALDTAPPPLRKLTSGHSAVTDVGQGPGDLSTNMIFTSSRGRFLNPFSGHDSSDLSGFHEGYDAKTPLALSFNPFARHQGRYPHEATANTISEDSAFREAVLDCIYKAIGLTQSVRGQTESPIAHQSPGLTSYDARNSKTSFSNAFGMLDPFEGMDDSESVISTALSASSTSGGLFGQHSDMKNEVEIVFFPKGSVLVEQGERNPGLYYIIDGFLDVSIPVDEKKGGPSTSFDLGAGGHATAPDHELSPLTATTSSSFKTATTGSGGKKMGRKSLFMIKPGGLAGYIGSMSAYRSFIDVRAKTDVYVGFLPRDALERIVDRHPVVLLTMAKRLTSLLPRLILHIDFALEWVQVDAGQVIYHQGDESDAIYIVLNGRLRGVLDDKNGKMQVVGEFGQGESVGELEVLTETTRPATVHAIRDTELARFPKTLFNSLALEHPGITIQISKIIASRMRSLIDNPLKGEMAGYSPAGITDRTTASSASPVKRGTNSTVNLRTVCILPVTAGVPVAEFGNRLSSALQQVGIANGVTLLNQAVVLSHLGRHAFSKMGKLKLSGYLADLEEKFGMVLYVADTNVNSPWTQTCISQADCILVVGLAEASPKIGEYERFLVGMKSTARKELVLLHVERYCRPGLTRKWLRVSYNSEYSRRF